MLTDKKTTFWNGKNVSSKTHVGAEKLIKEGPRTSLTQSKYQVSNETLAAADLQPTADTTTNLSENGG